MTPASKRPDLDRIGESAFTQVLNTLLPQSSTVGNPADRPARFDARDQTTASVVLTGPRLSGTVRVQLPKAFVRYAVQLLTGIDAAAADTNGLLDDTAGELANMVAGRVAARLLEDGYVCTLGAPTVSRSAPPPLEPPAGIERGRADLICEGHRLALEIQCRYTAP